MVGQVSKRSESFDLLSTKYNNNKSKTNSNGKREQHRNIFYLSPKIYICTWICVFKDLCFVTFPFCPASRVGRIFIQKLISVQNLLLNFTFPFLNNRFSSQYPSKNNNFFEKLFVSTNYGKHFLFWKIFVG